VRLWSGPNGLEGVLTCNPNLSGEGGFPVVLPTAHSEMGQSGSVPVALLSGSSGVSNSILFVRSRAMSWQILEGRTAPNDTFPSMDVMLLSSSQPMLKSSTCRPHANDAHIHQLRVPA
jgi:hypothetical protein